MGRLGEQRGQGRGLDDTAGGSIERAMECLPSAWLAVIECPHFA
jgi:hypothetical protein